MIVHTLLKLVLRACNGRGLIETRISFVFTLLMRNLSMFQRLTFEKRLLTIKKSSFWVFTCVFVKFCLLGEEHTVENESDLGEEVEDFATHDFTAIQPTFKGMRVHDKSRPHLANSFFKIRINGVRKYVHKQTACYILSEQKQTLSSDRTKRVTQAK